MTARLLIKCDGPQCNREISSDVHAGTWLTLQEYDIFKPKDDRVLKPNKHFCSNQCLHNHLLTITYHDLCQPL